MIDVDFYNVFYETNDATNFTADLFRLMAKADWHDLVRLTVGFPKEGSLYLWWVAQRTPPPYEEIRRYLMSLEQEEAKKSVR